MWVVFTVICYVFSIGPVMRLESIWQISDPVHTAIARFYGPLFITSDLLGLQGALQTYIFNWSPDKSLTIPHKNFNSQTPK